MRTLIHTSHIDHGKLAECFTHPEVYDEEVEPQDKAAEGFGRMLQWVYNPRCHDSYGQLARMYAVAFVVNPGLIQDRSLRQIERDSGGRITQGWLSQLAEQFRKEFGIK